MGIVTLTPGHRGGIQEFHLECCGKVLSTENEIYPCQKVQARTIKFCPFCSQRIDKYVFGDGYVEGIKDIINPVGREGS